MLPFSSRLPFNYLTSTLSSALSHSGLPTASDFRRFSDLDLPFKARNRSANPLAPDLTSQSSPIVQRLPITWSSSTTQSLPTAQGSLTQSSPTQSSLTTQSSAM